MHSFDELTYRSTVYMLRTLEKANEEVIEKLGESGATAEVKNMQMLELQKVFLVVGMFAMFDSILQKGLDSENGFKATVTLLCENNENDLCSNFEILNAAVNVLKHGKGRSYDYLLENLNILNFEMKLPNQNFFEEGELAELDTLIKVDDEFVQHCAEIIENTCRVIRKLRPEVLI